MMYRVKKFLAPLVITKEMSAQEFYNLASTKPHLIRRSQYVIPKIGSGQFGRFIVELDNVTNV